MGVKVKDLQKRFGLSRRQVHIRLDALSTLLDGHIHRGKKNAKILDQYAFSLFKRVVDIQSSTNRNVKEAVQQVDQELENKDSERDVLNVEQGNTPREPSVTKELRAQIDQQQDYIEFLRQELEKKDKQIQQLLPPAKEEVSLKDKTLWQVVKEWFKQPAS